ncbi:MAG: DUF2059 domain-containing protein [Acidobacteriales bacterium]|nr:DUF2059 domain-containing protein [Terriglobales bacterium]
MRHTLKVLSIVLFLTLACSAQMTVQDKQAPATREDVAALFKTLGLDEQLVKVMDVMVSQMRQMMDNNRDQSWKEKLSPEQVARFDKEMDALFAEMSKDFPLKAMMENLIPIYQKHFTREEIQAVTLFYSSPLGKKFVALQSDMQRESMEVNSQLIQTFAATQQAKAMARIRPLMEEFVQEMKKKSDSHAADKTTDKPGEPK